MNWMRSLHLGVAVAVPALTAVLLGLSLRILGREKRQVMRAMTTVIGRLGPSLAGVSIHAQHQQNMIVNRPAVYIFNHQSGLDPVIVCALLPQLAVGVAKRSLNKNPILGPLLRLTNTVFVERSPQGREYLMQQAAPLVDAGFSFAIAPEGTRIQQSSEGKQIGPFRSGAFLIAHQFQLPIVPFVIHNSAERLPARSSQLRPGPVYVSVLEPRLIQPEEQPLEVAKEMEQRYASCLAAGY